MDYISEPSLNSELILINNRKLLEKDKSLYNDKYLARIEELRKEYEKYDSKDNAQGLQKIKRDIRNEIRDLSVKTYVYRDKDIFGDMIISIIDNILKRPNFSGYNYKNEMKSLAIEHILKYTWKFDPYQKSEISKQYVSAFTYISTIAFNAFVATINKFNKENNKVKEDFLETQKLFHREPNTSKYGKDFSEIEKVVIFHLDNSSLFENIQKITLDVNDIQIKIPKSYHISIEEYNKIADYSKNTGKNFSILKDLDE